MLLALPKRSCLPFPLAVTRRCGVCRLRGRFRRSPDTRQRILDQFSNALSNFLGSERDRAVLYGGLEDRESLDPSEYLMFNHWLNGVASNVFNALRLRDEGTLDQEAFRLISNAFVGTCLTKGGSVWYANFPWKAVCLSRIAFNPCT